MSNGCECGLAYAADYPPDVRLHRGIHDAWAHGVKLSPLQSDRVVARHGGIEVLVVAPGAPRPQRHRARLVGSNANKETQYDIGVYSEYEGDEAGYATHAFLARVDGRAVGLVILRRREELWRTSWCDDGTPNREAAALISSMANRWTVDFAWTHRDHRRRGIAALVVRAAAAHLGVAVADLAWGEPFEPEGQTLARRLCPDVLYVAW
jgi:GNAT superfamily N-acetyltransferase